MSSFSVYKFVEKLRDYYDRNGLFEGNDPYNQLGVEDRNHDAARAAAIDEDKAEFIKAVLKNLYVYTCLDAVEFNLTVRSLATFFQQNKNIGMVIVDGLQYIENTEYLYQQEKKILNESMRERERKSGLFGSVAQGKDMNKSTFLDLADEMGEDVPSGEDFFFGGNNLNKSRVTNQKE